MRGIGLAIVGLAALAAADAVRADSGPVIAVPGRHGVPVPVNGCDAAYSVVEGDWGLFRPGQVSPVVIPCYPLPPGRGDTRRGYNFPRYGVLPARGRNEMEPPPDRPLPEPAEPFSRGWSTHSEIIVAPADLPPDPQLPPSAIDRLNPPIIIAPQIRRRP